MGTVKSSEKWLAFDSIVHQRHGSVKSRGLEYQMEIQLLAAPSIIATLRGGLG
jgi:hypothetical protein